jgi:hypothetical protein
MLSSDWLPQAFACAYAYACSHSYSRLQLSHKDESGTVLSADRVLFKQGAFILL